MNKADKAHYTAMDDRMEVYRLRGLRKGPRTASEKSTDEMCGRIYREYDRCKNLKDLGLISKTKALGLARHCFNDTLGGSRAQWCKSYRIGWTDYCINKVMFDTYAERIEPVMVGLKKQFLSHRKERFILVRCRSGVQRSRMDDVLVPLTYQLRRQARVKNAVGRHTKAHLRTIWEIQKGRCYFSGKPLGRRFEDRKFTVDHLVPLGCRSFPLGDVPGTNWPINLALVTFSVNSMKGGQRPDEFAETVRRRKSFKLTPAKERGRIDAARRVAFYDFMCENCSKKIADWF